MEVKRGTKTWTDSVSQTEQDLRKVSTLTDQQKEKLGAEDVGAVLNKAANPNWVDPSKQVQGRGSTNMDKDAFFKLMLTQMKNQDPMNPVKNHEMAAQLAQFSTLEQMSNMNQTLTKIEGQKTDNQFQALNLIGKIVAGDSSKVSRTQFDKNHDFNFNLPQDATEATVKVSNSKGDVLREFKLTNLKAGANKINWNGQSDKGLTAEPGDYDFKIDAKNSAGQKIAVKTDFSGTISGLSFSGEGPVLQVGSQSIKMRDVRQITDPSAKQNDQIVQDVTGQDLKTTEAQAQTNIKHEANTSNKAKPQGMSDVMTEVAMSRDLMDKLQKEMK